MIDLKELVEAIQFAVIEAADQVRLKNLNILQDYFVASKDQEAEDEGKALVPRMINMEFPEVTETGPRIHVVRVPLICIAPPTNLYLSEFRARLKVDFGLEGGEGAKIKLAPVKKSSPPPTVGGGQTPAHDGEIYREAAEIEIVLRHADLPAGLADIVQGYDRALRAEIPG